MLSVRLSYSFFVISRILSEDTAFMNSRKYQIIKTCIPLSLDLGPQNVKHSGLLTQRSFCKERSLYDGRADRGVRQFTDTFFFFFFFFFFRGGGGIQFTVTVMRYSSDLDVCQEWQNFYRRLLWMF